ncbi:MAG: RNA pyrophosphohydrolase [Rhodospirillales bacterium]|nr:RNA pyrophosphohydrolase [Rhodospirillales bacterium]
MSGTEALPYRPCVGALIVNRQGLVFMARRYGLPSPDLGWQMPQGGIDDGEAPLQAVRREVAEETGIVSLDLIGESSGTYRYDLPDDLVGTALGGHFQGQDMKWFVFRFIGGEDEIDLNREDPPEFEDWKWVPVDQAANMIVPFKRRLYEQVVSELGHHAVPLT